MVRLMTISNLKKAVSLYEQRYQHKKHDWGHCPGSICAGDPTPDFEKNVIWYPGEPACTRTPLLRWQKNQRRINKLMRKGTFKHPHRYFTSEMLQKIQRVTQATKGGNPERCVWVK